MSATSMMTWVEIDSRALRHNLTEFKKLVGAKTSLMPVIKANAYGHGFLDVARICDRSPKIDRLCVVNDDEALLLIVNGFRKKIQILTFFETSNTKKALKLAKKGVIFPLFTLKQAIFLNKIGESAHKRISVHIKVDTGAARVGLTPEEVAPFLRRISKLERLKIEGIYSHFAASEEDKIFTNHQIENFNSLRSDLASKGYSFDCEHIACSSAAVLFPQSRNSAVRIGLSLYGLYPEELSRKKIVLKPVLSWKTKIIQVRTLPPWTKIGYGGSFTTKKKTTIAVLPVGYYDGYDRRLSNNSEVIINGVRCPVRGRICMNIMMVELPPGCKAQTGDTAILIGKSGRSQISVDDLARRCSTINYEIVDRINPLLPRITV